MTVLEIMAGDGGNLEWLLEYFHHVEMQGESQQLTSLPKEKVTVHPVSLMSFQIPTEKFDCVIGYWALSSAPLEQVENLIARLD